MKAKSILRPEKNFLTCSTVHNGCNPCNLTILDRNSFSGMGMCGAWLWILLAGFDDPSDRRRLEGEEPPCFLFGRAVAVVTLAADLIADPNDVLLEVFFSACPTCSTTLISLRFSFSSCNKALAFFPNSFTFPSIDFVGSLESGLFVPCCRLTLFLGGIACYLVALIVSMRGCEDACCCLMVDGVELASGEWRKRNVDPFEPLIHFLIFPFQVTLKPSCDRTDGRGGREKCSTRMAFPSVFPSAV